MNNPLSLQFIAHWNIFISSLLTSSGKSLGWGEVKRILMLGSMRDTWSRSSANRIPPCLVLYTVRNPSARFVLVVLDPTARVWEVALVSR